MTKIDDPYSKTEWGREGNIFLFSGIKPPVTQTVAAHFNIWIIFAFTPNWIQTYHTTLHARKVRRFIRWLLTTYGMSNSDSLLNNSAFVSEKIWTKFNLLTDSEVLNCIQLPTCPKIMTHLGTARNLHSRSRYEKVFATSMHKYKLSVVILFYKTPYT
jgi:hypothetical protein